MKIINVSLRNALRWTAAGLPLLLGFGASSLAWAQTQSCIDNSVINCFNGCNNPSNFQECIIGCATGANRNPQNCVDQCFGDPTCLSKCQLAIDTIETCAAPSSRLSLVAGMPVFNRSTRVWQQQVRLTNTTLTYSVSNIAIVLEGEANGWNLANATASTGALGAGGSYLDLPTVLQPGESVTVQLVYSRSGTLPFRLVPRAYSSLIR